ncbi:MAG: type II secretion system F family protein [Verrucomicrobiaceae bacterium]
MSPKDKSHLYQEYAKLVDAGFGMNDATTTLLDTGQEAGHQEFLMSIQASMKAGRSIAEAFEESPVEMLEMETSIIDAGERGGRLGVAFQQLADYFDLLANSRKEMTRSLIYPAVLFHLAVLLSVIPFSLFHGLGKDGGEIMRDFMIKLAVCYVLGFLCFLGVRWLMRRAPNNAAIDRVIGWIPLIGKSRKNLALARFVKVYHGSLAAGLSMHGTVKMATEAAHSGVIREAGKDLKKAVDDGQAVGPVFQAHKVFPVAFSRSYATAEKSGSLDADLTRWSKKFAEEARTSARMVTVLLPKAFYFLVAAYIGWKIISVYMGYYEGLEEMMDEF